MSPFSYTLSGFRVNQFLPFLLNVACLNNPTKIVRLVQIGFHHHFMAPLTCSRHDIAEFFFLVAVKQQSLEIFT
jgi:hypothetical protein